MKRIFILVITVLCAASLFAQAPEKFTYQAVVRNASNSLVANAPVGVRVSILQGGVNGTLVYMETHTSVTNANGLITLQIGSGSVQQGSFADIDWANGSYFLKTETDPVGGTNYSITSTQQMLSVPYALYAKDAGNIPTIPTNVSAFANDAGYITVQDVPEIPTVPTNVSAFTNDAGYLTNFTETDPTVPAWAKAANKPTYNYSEITNTPTIPTVPTQVSAFTNDAGYLTSFTETDPQFNAWDKDYNDLINKPVIPTVPTNVSSFTNDAGYLTSYTEQQILTISNDTVFLTGGSFVKLPEGFDGDYNSLSNKPTLFDGDYNSLTNKPNLFSGNYNDLSNRPEIPVVPTNVSSFTNDAGYLTGYTETDPQFNAWDKDYNDLINKPTIPTVPTNVSAFNNDAGYITAAQVPAQVNADWNATSGVAKILNKPALFSGNYNDLTNKPTLFDGNYNSLTNKPTFATVATTGNYNDLSNKPALFSGNYNDLTNKPTIPTVPSNVSVFNNDAHYITEAQLNALLAAMNNTIDSLRDRIEELEQNPQTPSTGLPSLITTTVSNVTGTSAQCGGNITADGGSNITERGVCWGVSPLPTVSGNHTSDGTGTGSFVSYLYGLQSGVTYYVRAYATNSAGTAYGNVLSFTTATPTLDGNACPGMETVTDYDGNVYTTVQIGQQCWMKENLRSTHYDNGTAIASASEISSTIACYYPVPGNFYNGNLYNWKAVMGGFSSSAASPSGVQGICPNGWHVPSDAEWTQLTNYVSGQSDFLCSIDTTSIAKALASTTGWASDSTTCAVGNTQSSNNATGFGALPAGFYSASAYYGSSYLGPGRNAAFWSSTEASSGSAWRRGLYYNSAYVYRNSLDKSYGYSVRCLRD